MTLKVFWTFNNTRFELEYGMSLDTLYNKSHRIFSAALSHSKM